jgi:hypothetical protein
VSQLRDLPVRHGGVLPGWRRPGARRARRCSGRGPMRTRSPVDRPSARRSRRVRTPVRTPASSTTRTRRRTDEADRPHVHAGRPQRRAARPRGGRGGVGHRSARPRAADRGRPAGCCGGDGGRRRRDRRRRPRPRRRLERRGQRVRRVATLARPGHRLLAAEASRGVAAAPRVHAASPRSSVRTIRAVPRSRPGASRPPRDWSATRRSRRSSPTRS